MSKLKAVMVKDIDPNIGKSLIFAALRRIFVQARD